ncbi:MAG: phosphoribosylformylglycinamidine cyclo-ligase [Candidatus Peregrinibacteria bacterium]
MTTYKDSGVDIEMGDKCSQIAYQAAKNTFIGRKGMIGEPVIDDGGFAGALDMGDYYLVQNDDGVGSKSLVAEKIGKYDTLGYDLIAMVADDAVCIGAETISITNTIDVPKVDEKRITQMMAGLEKAALEQKIVIPGGEIAELGEMLTGYIWNATAVGIVKKEKLIKTDQIKEGDKIIGLNSDGFRSNGFSLVRHILNEKLGEQWPFEKFNSNFTWGEKVLIPSKIYSNAVLSIHGRFNESPKVQIKAIAHITGGGIPGNIARVLKKSGLGANINALPTPHEVMQKLIELGNVETEEAYKTWNMGVGMILIASPENVNQIQDILSTNNVESQLIGEVTTGKIILDI